MIRDLDLQRMLYAPSAESIRGNLPSMADALQTACLELSRDCSIARCDELSARLKAAQTSLQHLRRALISERSTGHGTG